MLSAACSRPSVLFPVGGVACCAPAAARSGVLLPGAARLDHRRSRDFVALASARDSPADLSGALDAAALDRFDRDGFLVLPAWASMTECKVLRSRAAELVAGFQPQANKSVFSTKDQSQKPSDNSFMRSANGIGFFLEEGAVGSDGELLRPKEQAVNKIGHAMHDLASERAFRSFSRSPKVAALLKQLGFVAPIPVQSMYIFKQPGIGGEVVPHQDSTFLNSTPPTCVGLWWALEDATIHNGCLRAIPGSHSSGVYRRFVQDAAGKTSFLGTQPEFDLGSFVPLEVTAGTLVVLHGAVVHMSYANTSSRSRHAYSIHVVESGRGVTYGPENWLQRDASFPFVPLYTP